MWVLAICFSPREEEPVFLTTEPPLQALVFLFLFLRQGLTHYVAQATLKLLILLPLP